MRVVIAEDSVVLRDGLVRLLAGRGLDVVAEVGDAPGLLPAVTEHRPDVAVVDVRMPPTHTDDGLRAALDVRAAHPDVGILVFSQYVETTFAAKLLAERSDGVGYLLKDRVGEVGEFVEAVTRVASGGTALDPEVVSRLMRSKGPAESLVRLTPREREVLELMAEGRSNAAIATELVVSAGAVEKYVTSVFGKLDLPVAEHTNRRVLAVLRYLQDA